MNPDTNRFEPLRQLDAESPEKLDELRRQMEAKLPPKYTRAGEAARDAVASLGGSLLVRPNGEPVPEHWTQFALGEQVVIKNYTFKVAYVGETAILFEPVGPVLVGKKHEP